MEWMDQARRTGAALWVGGGLLAMLAWQLTDPAHPPGGVTWLVVAIAAAGTAAMFVGLDRLRWWGGRLSGVAVGAELVGAVADRFGAFGGPGDPMVSWGDWSHFRIEVAELVPWPGLVTPAAVTATVVELLLGTLLLAGPWWRWVGKATAGLFVVYLVAMVPGMGAASLLEYGVPVLVGAGLATSARGARPGSRATRPLDRSARALEHR